ncbi:hypothetical protein M427DRAFT_391011 [Gonapodya prolifera JEL478]|uniref:Transmembrane protein n=1 Tax=Gonapodya prolifera (strain JEL478) TaxID=1344416 RepID=A0A139A7P3_GONPJ|nr:hypothetical protein M427DRAFT_391011 [Gonapodya prolifera JEL478]|eukprot:KXS12709.1 hypothetical protein M427DRAFT_391011 [Gonapodya prolifera JEL478]
MQRHPLEHKRYTSVFVFGLYDTSRRSPHFGLGRRGGVILVAFHDHSLLDAFAFALLLFSFCSAPFPCYWSFCYTRYHCSRVYFSFFAISIQSVSMTYSVRRAVIDGM